jgi:hypothetical protein
MLWALPYRRPVLLANALTVQSAFSSHVDTPAVTGIIVLAMFISLQESEAKLLQEEH